MPKLVFEDLDAKGAPVPFRRAKIMGGWLVMVQTQICFVPDPEHKWDGGSLPS